MRPVNQPAKLWFFAFAILFFLTSAAIAQEVQVTASFVYGAMYVPDGWTPLRVEVRNNSNRSFEGKVVFTPTAGSLPEFQGEITSPAHSRSRTILWVYLRPGPKKKPISIIELHNQAGQSVARSELVGNALVDDAGHAFRGLPNAGYLLSLIGDDIDLGDEKTLQLQADILKQSKDWRSGNWTLSVHDAMRNATWYRDAYAIALTGVDPGELDATQRKALLDYVVGGGTLLVCAPDAQTIDASWLKSYLPVKLLGTRQMKSFEVRGEKQPHKLTGWMTCTEAVAGDGEILLDDGKYVHAALKHLGLGQIVFTSFPPSGLDASDPRTANLWGQLLNDRRPAIGPWGTRLENNYGHLMEPMLGKQTAPWGVAAAVVCGIVILSLVTQLIWRQARRPMAFAVSLGGTVAVAAIFAGLAMFQQESQPLQEARLSITDLTDDGGMSYEYAVLSGTKKRVVRVATDDDVALQLPAWHGERPTIAQWPVRVENLIVQSEQVPVVTLASRIIRYNLPAGVRGWFDEKGLNIETQNSWGLSLDSAQLVWGKNRFALGNLDTGTTQRKVDTSTVLVGNDLGGSGMINSQDAQRKGEILLESLQAADSQARTSPGVAPMITAWSSRPPGLSTVKDESPLLASQNLVRIPLRLQPATPGSRVKIDGFFNHLTIGVSKGLPYDFNAQEFVSTQMGGAWVFGVRPPAEIGRIQPLKVHLQVDLASPQHTLTLRRGQVGGGKISASGNPAGELVASWDNKVGIQKVDFTCGAGDVDANGVLWLRLEVKRTGSIGALGVEPQWKINRFLADLEAQVQ